MRHYFYLIISFFILSCATNKTVDQAQTGTKRFLYVGRAPKERDGFRTQKASLEVFDIDNNHKLVKVIPLPETVMNIRGIMAHAPSKRIFISHYGSLTGGHTGYMLALDLVTEKVLWHEKYESAVDRGAVTPDGKKIFMPSGEDAATPYFYVINAATGKESVTDRVEVAPRTHNTIVSPDNSKVFMSAFGPEMGHNWLHVVDAKTNKIIRKIGPCFAVVRPFTINGKGTLAFINVNKLIGFEVGDVATGKILHTVSAPEPYKLPADIRNSVFSHGIAITPDEKEVWVVDQKTFGLHVFDVSGLPLQAPVWKQFIKTNGGREKDANNELIYEDKGIFGQPGWIMGTLDGKYFYPESGEIIDTKTKQIIGHLTGANGKWAHSRFALEIDFKNGKPLKAGDQFVVGQVRGKK